MAISPDARTDAATTTPDASAAGDQMAPPSRRALAAGAILALGAALRLVNLGVAPYAHDEAIHANFSLNLDDYHYDPTYHGPLLYHLTALVFYGLGAHDFSARLVPALAGIALLSLVLWPARCWIGARGALWGAALLAISPVTVAYSRRLLHDALVLALSLGAVLCFQAARQTPGDAPAGRRARVVMAVLLSLLLATKANAFFIIAMLAALWLADVLRPSRRPGKSAGEWAWWAPSGALSAVAVASVFALREPPQVRENNERMLAVVCLLALAAVWEWLRRAPTEAKSGNAAREESRAPMTASQTAAPARAWDWKTPLLAAAVAILLFAFFYGRGVLWWRDPLHAIARYTGDVVGPGSALPRMLGYWGGQQSAPRLPGRHDYYIVLMLLYEAPIVIAAIGGLLRASRRRTPFTDLLLWWALTAFAVYALANEKVPWLLVHIMLPLCLLAGWWLSQIHEELQARRRQGGAGGQRPMLLRGFAIACTLGAAFLLRGMSATNFERAGDRHEPLFYAQTTETFRDALFGGLQRTAGSAGGIWVFSGNDLPGKEWPSVWYLREGAPLRGNSPLWMSHLPEDAPLRLALLPDEDDWKTAIIEGKITLDQWRAAQRRLRGWSLRRADFIIWPRASWPALRPDRFALFWLFRVAPFSPDAASGQPDSFLSEWSSSPVVVATPPQRGLQSHSLQPHGLQSHSLKR